METIVKRDNVLNHNDVVLSINKALFSFVRFESEFLNNIYKLRKYIAEDSLIPNKNIIIINSYIDFSDIILFTLGLEFHNETNFTEYQFKKFSNNFISLKPKFEKLFVEKSFNELMNHYYENGFDELCKLKLRHTINNIFIELDCDFYIQK